MRSLVGVGASLPFYQESRCFFGCEGALRSFRSRFAAYFGAASRRFRAGPLPPRTLTTVQKGLLFSFSMASGLLKSSSRPISIVKLHALLRFHRRPITLSSSRGLSRLRAWNLLLEVGFTLRCLQRLSRPHFASLLCRWHDNSCTRGASIPVLSY